MIIDFPTYPVHIDENAVKLLLKKKNENIMDFSSNFTNGASEKDVSALLYPLFMIKEERRSPVEQTGKWLVIRSQPRGWWNWQ